jgi:PRTRC genetic system ThiF family protein
MKRHYTHKYLLDPFHPVTVNLIGVGGTGSQVLTCLARIDHALQGLGHPGLHVRAYDPDFVSESNIGRQLFSTSDLGLNKALVLVTRLNRFFLNKWEAVPEIFQMDESANITISCVDNVKSRIEMNGHFKSVLKTSRTDYKEEMYWLDFGNARNTGQIVLGTVRPVDQPTIEGIESVSELKTIADLFDLTEVKDEDSGPGCSLAESLTKQDLFVNSTLAQLGSALLWKLISTGSIDYHGAYLNLQTMNVNPIKF